MNPHRMTLLAASLLVIPGWTAHAAPETLEDYTARYEEYVAGIEEAHGEALKAALDDYGKALDTVQEALRRKGDLEGWLAAKQEKERFDRERSVPTETGAGLPTFLVGIRDRYRRAVAKADAEKDQKMAGLLKPYITGLDSLKKRLMLEDEMDEAARVHKEIKKAEFILADLQIRLPDDRAAPQTLPGKGSIPLHLRNGLLLHYSFDKDERGRVTDESVEKNHAIVHGAAWTAEGRSGGAYQFDGRDDYLESIRVSPIKGNEQRTLGVWVTLHGFRRGTAVVPVGFGEGNSYRHPDYAGTLYGIACHSANGDTVFGMWGMNQGDVWSETPISLNEWYHVLATYDGKAVRLYLNGRLDVAKEVPVRTHVSRVVLSGIWGDYPGRRRFDGVIDEVMLWDRALSAPEVRQVYDAQK